MRIFHLLPAKWGMSAIANKRIKISTFGDLNDPFELLAANLKEKHKRIAFRAWKQEIGASFGLLCFSRDWESPVLWSHYAEKHQGLCLGFEVPDDKISSVNYEDSRTDLNKLPLNEKTALHLLTKKYSEWYYEKEMRVFTRLVEKDELDNYYYAKFSSDLVLREVIVGALSKISRRDILQELHKTDLNPSHIELKRARLAFGSYAIIQDKRGLR